MHGLSRRKFIFIAFMLGVIVGIGLCVAIPLILEIDHDNETGN